AASHAIVEAARTAPGEAGLAAALVETAAQSVAPTPAAEAVTRGAQGDEPGRAVAAGGRPRPRAPAGGGAAADGPARLARRPDLPGHQRHAPPGLARSAGRRAHLRLPGRLDLAGRPGAGAPGRPGQRRPEAARGRGLRPRHDLDRRVPDQG